MLVDNLTATAKRQWVRAHVNEPCLGVRVTGVVTGHKISWTHDSFQESHPEIVGDVSIKQQHLTVLADAEPTAPQAVPQGVPDVRNLAVL